MLVYKNHNLIKIGVAGAVEGRFSTFLKSTRITVFTTVSNVFIQPRHPGSFHYAPRWRKDPGPGWSRVSQILGDNKIFS